MMIKKKSKKETDSKSTIQSLELTKKYPNKKIKLMLLDKNFTACHVHYLEGFSIKCGNPCELCNSAVKRDIRYLIPVYNFHTGQPEVLSVSKSRDRKGALLPQLVGVINNPQRQLIFISKPNDFDFKISTGTPSKKEKVVFIKERKKMRLRLKAGKVDIQNVYQKVSDKELKKFLEQKKEYESVGIILEW